MTISAILILKFWIILAASCGYALWRGGAPERIAAGSMVIAAIGSTVLLRHPFSAWETVQWGIFASDVALLIVLVGLALRAERYWPLWVAAFQLVAVVVHLARFLDVTITVPVYGIVQSLWAYPMLLALMWATVRHRQRLKRFGADKSWSRYSLPFDPSRQLRQPTPS